jgi:4-amino-4-deoxy-L-arabinose transferase-like glycosyltransferase
VALLRPAAPSIPRAAPPQAAGALPRALVDRHARALAAARVTFAAAGVFLLTRIVRLDALPLFTDEGFYLEWALYALHSPSWTDKLMSISDGKQPLLPWLMAPFLALIDDRTIAGRLAPVTAGLASFLTLYWLGRRLYGGMVGVLAALLYLVAPLSYFHDRIMLYDGLIAACALLSFAAALRWLERPGLARSLALGACLVLALLTKVTALAVVATVLPLAALVQPPPWRDARLWRGAALAAVMCLGVAGALMLHPHAATVLQSVTDRYALSQENLAQEPWRVWAQTLRDIGHDAAHYLPAPLWWLWGAGLCLPVFTRRREDLALSAWSLWLGLSLVLLAKVYYFRYYVPALIVATLPAARALDLLLRGISSVVRRALPGRDALAARLAAGTAAVAAAAVVAPGVLVDAQLALDPRRAPLAGGPRGDAFHYQASHNTAWGFDPVARFLDEQARRGEAVYVLPALGGLTRGWAQVSLLFRPGAHIVLNDPRVNPAEQVLALDPDDEARRIAVSGGPVYVVASEWADSPSASPLLEGGRVRAQMVVDAPNPAIAQRHRVYRLDLPRELDRARWRRPPVFGGRITLLGLDVEPPAAGTAARRVVTLYWRSDRTLDRAYAVFVHLVAGGFDGHKVAQDDGDPGGGRLPTDRWRPGEVIRDRRVLELAAAPCGELRLLVGLYERTTQVRLAAEGGGLAVRDNAVDVLTVPANPSGCAG